MGEELDNWDSTLLAIESSINQRVVLPDVEPGTALRRLAAVFLQLKVTAEAITGLVDEALTSVDLYFETAPLVMAFEYWQRGLAGEARSMVVTAARAASELVERADPNAIALYRPHAKEHLYAISTRFYGTPFNWRRIATRNRLGEATVLSGEELLVIPEATGR